MSKYARLIGADEFITGGGSLYNPKIRFCIYMVKCCCCDNSPFPSLEKEPRFCPYCGAELRFPKHMRQEAEVSQYYVERLS